jgi:chromosome segregation ATPase
MTDIRLFFGGGRSTKTIDATINTQPYTTMNQQSETQEFDPMFAENMSDIQKLCSMTEKLSLRLNVMKETYEQAMPAQYENGYIQGFKDRYEGLQPRYKDINDKANQWYDYYTMETHRLHQLNFQKIKLESRELQDEIMDLQMGYLELQDANQRLKDENKENQETIKRLQSDRAEFQVKARDDMMNLRARNCHIQNDCQRTNDEMIDLEKRCHKFSCDLQDENHILKEENQRLKEENQILKDENSDLEQENQIILKEEKRLKDENRDNEETIKRIQVDRAEFQYALVKARDEIMELKREEKEEIRNLRARKCDLQNENWALITVNKENQEKMKRLETQFQSSLVKAETLQTNIYYNSKDI